MIVTQQVQHTVDGQMSPMVSDRPLLLCCFTDHQWRTNQQVSKLGLPDFCRKPGGQVSWKRQNIGGVVPVPVLPVEVLRFLLLYNTYGQGVFARIVRASWRT